jgi:co-chaperonin GroES (HSP10)
MEETIRARGPWVLIKADPPPTMSKGGLYLPEGNLEERLGHLTGTVLSAGNEAADSVSIGDKVLFRGYLKDANHPAQLDDNRSLINVKDIVGVIED